MFAEPIHRKVNLFLPQDQLVWVQATLAPVLVLADRANQAVLGYLASLQCASQQGGTLEGMGWKVCSWAVEAALEVGLGLANWVE